ncbi:hypothetical protein D3C85_1130890 [compost metagenome]
MVSSDFGKLDARRHSTAGLLPTTAGAAGALADAAGAAGLSSLPHAARAPVAATADAFNRKERRSMTSPLIDICALTAPPIGQVQNSRSIIAVAFCARPHSRLRVFARDSHFCNGLRRDWRAASRWREVIFSQCEMPHGLMDFVTRLAVKKFAC